MFGLAQLYGCEGFAGAARRVASPAPSQPVAATALAELRTSPEDLVRTAIAEVRERLASDLLEGVRSLSPAGFERLIVDVVGSVLAAGGVEYARKHLGKSGDGGVDGVVDEDRLGLGRVYVQAKRYKDGNAVGPGEIHQFSGALTAHGATKGVFVTASTFTSVARAAHDALSKSQQIKLIDGPGLVEIMIEYGVGVRPIETFVIAEVALEKYMGEDS